MNSLEKALWIINRLALPPYEMTLSELARELGMTPAGVSKIMNVLEQQFFVARNSSSKTYSIGPSHLRLSYVYNQMRGIQSIGVPFLHKIRELTGETAIISIREGTEGFLAYKVDGDSFLRSLVRVGKHLAINGGAAGKLHAAWLPEEVREKALANRVLERMTPSTITDPQLLRKEYEKIRSQGYSLSLGEVTEGEMGLAVPIFDKDGAVWCCLTIGSTEDKKHRVEEWLPMLEECAERISEALQFRR